MANENTNDSGVKKVSRTLEGNVISDKMDKTIVVKVDRRFRHPLNGKIVQCSKNYKVHDEESVAKVGDRVEIKETRPLSKTKHMMLHRVVRKVQ